MDQKLFRRDLFYRLNVFPIRVPSLSERRVEIPALLKHFLAKYNEKFGTQKLLEDDAQTYLSSCEWPGNIRELENTLQRLIINASSGTITLLDAMRELHADMIPAADRNPEELIQGGMSLEAMVENFEKGILRHAVEKYGSSRKAAKRLGISQTQYLRKKAKYGLGSK